MEKKIIATNQLNEEDYKEDFNEWCEANHLNQDEQDIYDFMADEAERWLECEQLNLNIPCGRILAIADLGLWNGRRTAYKIINASTIGDILKDITADYYTFYCNKHGVYADLTHHDGTNHIEFREIRAGREKALRRLTSAIYNQEPYTRRMVTDCTRSLAPMAKALYGWK